MAYAPRSVQQQKRPWLSCPRARRHHRGPARWARHCRPVSGHAHSQRPRRECLPHGPAVPHGHVKDRVTGAPSAVASTQQALDMFGKEGKKGSKGKWVGRWTPRKGSRWRPHACRGPSPCQGSGAFRPQPCFPPLPFGSASEGFLWRPSQTFCPPSSQILVTFGDRKMGRLAKGTVAGAPKSPGLEGRPPRFSALPPRPSRKTQCRDEGQGRARARRDLGFPAGSREVGGSPSKASALSGPCSSTGCVQTKSSGALAWLPESPLLRLQPAAAPSPVCGGPRPGPLHGDQKAPEGFAGVQVICGSAAGQWGCRVIGCKGH